jgi:DNA invertase Pin-like site-specific DNA recombinase
MFSFFESITAFVKSSINEVDQEMSNVNVVNDKEVNQLVEQPKIIIQQQSGLKHKDSVIYTRVSTELQNLEAQLYACEQFCEMNNLKIINHYSEKCSAYKKNSQSQLKNLIKNNKNVNLIVFSVDRFSRNVSECNEFIENLNKNNITMIAVKENINMSTALGKHKFREMVSIAQYESELISERVRNNIKFKKENGIHIGKAPYGKNVINGKLVTNMQERYVIQFIIKTARKQMTVEKLNDLLFNLMTQLQMSKDNFVKLEITKEDNEYVYKQYMPNDKIIVTMSSISDILNEYNILKKGKRWTVSGINNVLKTNLTIKNFHRISL